MSSTRSRGQGLAGPVAVRNERDRRALRRDLERSLLDLAARVGQPGTQVLDVGLVAQVCSAPSYVDWKAEHDRAWHEQGAQLSTASWPAQLDEGAYGVLLLTLAAGRVGVAVGKFPRAVATPVFSSGLPPRNAGYEDIVLSVVARWAGNPASGATAQLAPPVIELVQRNRVVERRLADFGQRWPLPAPDGL